MTNARSFSLKLLSILAFVLAATVPARAQITDIDNSTSVPIPGVGHDYIHMLNETVDPANGSVSLRIAVPTPRGRGITLPFSFAYDTQGIYVPNGLSGQGFKPVGNVDPLRGLGWSYTVPRLNIQTGWYTYPAAKTGQGCNFWSNFILNDSNGGVHVLGLTPSQQTTNCRRAQSLSSGDLDYRGSTQSQSGVAATVLAADADGSTYSWASSIGHGCGAFIAGTCNTVYLATQIEDRNGSQIKIQDLNSGAFKVTDDLGRTLLTSSGFGKSGNTLTVSGLAQPYQITWSSGSTSFSTLWTLLDGTACGVTGSLEDTNGWAGITAISLPNGKQYTFAYDPIYGLVSKVTYPSGGWIEYEWTVNPQSAATWLANRQGLGNQCLWRYDKPALSHRFISFDGVNVSMQQDFTYSTTWETQTFGEYWSGKQTIVTTHDLVRGTSFQTTYSYVPGASAEPYNNGPFPLTDTQLPVEQTIKYQDTNGNLLRTVTKVVGQHRTTRI